MISPPKNRVQAIKCKFENLNSENLPLIGKNNFTKTEQLCKYTALLSKEETHTKTLKAESVYEVCNISKAERNYDVPDIVQNSSRPNASYLYKDVSQNDSVKSLLARQSSDPGKKLHRSHAFRCDKSQKIGEGPARHGSCRGRSETTDFSSETSDKKLSKERLKQLGDLLDNKMREENFVVTNDSAIVGEVRITAPHNSVPDSEVPKHILDQYAKVNKSKHKEPDKQEAMTDSGVSSETENLEEEKNMRVSKNIGHLKKDIEINVLTKNVELNSNFSDNLTLSSDTMRLVQKNPHIILTDTLKKALKQPLPPGPPPKKPPRILNSASNSNDRKKNTKQMLEKLEEVLHKRETQNKVKNIYDIAETDLSKRKPKDMHYLCTDITESSKSSTQSEFKIDCFTPLKCAIVAESTTSLPYTRITEENSVRCCVCGSNSSSDKRISTFLKEKLCQKCLNNDVQSENFKCHLNCSCVVKKSEFFLNEPIYDEPCVSFGDVNKKCLNVYGTLNKSKVFSKSMEDLRLHKNTEDQQIYDIPCDRTLTPSPEPKYTSILKKVPNKNFEKLRQCFENGEQNQPVEFRSKIKHFKSTENLSDNYKQARKCIIENKFATEAKRYKKRENGMENRRYSTIKKSSQIDVDRENLNRLMNEIYDTVTAACSMDEKRQAGFPSELTDSTTSEDSAKQTRSLTEKRKNYVRRVSSRVAYIEPSNIKSLRHRHQTSICSYKSDIVDNQQQYATFRSWKSFRTSRTNLNQSKMSDRCDFTDSKFNLTDSRGNVMSELFTRSNDSMDNLSIDEKTGCVDIELPFEARDRGLFNVCLLVGMNYMTGQAYVKSVFPKQVQVPPHIENLIFPETLNGSSRDWSPEANMSQSYSMVLTDERGERSYGYCRRVLPECAATCLPLCYCLIGRYRAPGFYYKVLQEIESHHGSSEVEINTVLQQLFETDFPNPGEEITLSFERPIILRKHSISLNLDFLKTKSMPNAARRTGCNTENMTLSMDDSNLNSRCVQPNLSQSEAYVRNEDNMKHLDCYDLENNNTPRKCLLSFDRMKTIKRPIEPRVDEDNLSILLEVLGAGLSIKVFASLLLERKVVIVSDQLSNLSSCMEALQSSLYPFVWQQPLISTIPSEIRRDVLEAPLPLLAGVLKTSPDDCLENQPGFEEGMLIDLTHPSKVLCYQGDEATILPTCSYKSLKTALQMETIKSKEKREDRMTRNVLISEAFMRFFVDILGDIWRFFSIGELKEGGLGKGHVVFDKENFIKTATSKQNQCFLEWFTETAMFNHFIQNMCVLFDSKHATSSDLQMTLIDCPLPNFYELFEERVKNRNKNNSKNLESKNNYKNALNRKMRLLKTKLKDLIS